MELLIGAGSRREKILYMPGESADWDHLVTLDINPDHNPDVVWDLNNRPLPFEDNTFDSIRAFEVLEHLGQQGDWRGFFSEWSEWWRILRPGGYMIGTSPHWASPWCWGDPGHTRVISSECLTFLCQPQYDEQVGKTPMTDYRFCYQADFDFIHSQVHENGTYSYGLKAVKPSRCTRSHV